MPTASWESSTVPDDSAKAIAASYRRDIEINERRMRDALGLPADLLPVDAYQIAYYRKRYLEALAAHNRTLDEYSRLIEAGGEAVLDAWSSIYRTEPADDGRDSGIRAPRPDGDCGGAAADP